MTVRAVVSMTQYGDGSWSWRMDSDDHPEWNCALGHVSPTDALLTAARWIKYADQRSVTATAKVKLCLHVDGTWGAMVSADPPRPGWEFATANFDDPESALVAAASAIATDGHRAEAPNSVAADIARAQVNEDPLLAHQSYLFGIARKVNEL